MFRNSGKFSWRKISPLKFTHPPRIFLPRGKFSPWKILQQKILPPVHSKMVAKFQIINTVRKQRLNLIT